jgi:hypothetical protein
MKNTAVKTRYSWVFHWVGLSRPFFVNLYKGNSLTQAFANVIYKKDKNYIGGINLHTGGVLQKKGYSGTG